MQFPYESSCFCDKKLLWDFMLFGCCEIFLWDIVRILQYHCRIRYPFLMRFPYEVSCFLAVLRCSCEILCFCCTISVRDIPMRVHASRVVRDMECTRWLIGRCVVLCVRSWFGWFVGGGWMSFTRYPNEFSCFLSLVRFSYEILYAFCSPIVIWDILLKFYAFAAHFSFMVSSWLDFTLFLAVIRFS